MKVVTYKCDKCGRELTEWGVVRMRVGWECRLKCVEDWFEDKEYELCKECAKKVERGMRGE